MVKRFSKYQNVTLCLIQQTAVNDINTWCVNVKYLKQDKEWRYFSSSEKLYKVHKQSNLVRIFWTEIVYEGELFEEWDEIEMFDFAHCTNIVNGWQW